MQTQIKPDLKVIIIGGGVTGLFTAYFLQKENFDVTIIDEGPANRAASHGNCGLVSPSHVLPLNHPRLLWKAVKWLVKPDSPFYIKPRWNFSLIKWLLGFAMYSGNQSIRRAMYGRHNLLQSSRTLYDKILAELEIDCQWSDEGILFLFKSERAFRRFSTTNDRLNSAIGLYAEPYVGQALTALEPAIRDDVYGGFLYKNDASLKPDELVSGMTTVLREKGVKFIQGKRIVGFKTNGKSILEAISGEGDAYSGSFFVLAGGAMSPLLQSQLGVKIPVQPGKGYSITMKSPGLSPKIPCIFEEKKVVATPWNGAYRLGGTMEFASYDTSLNKKRLNALKVAAGQYLREPFTDEAFEEWAGWRPMSMDELPIIDRLPDYHNGLIACGHGMLGLSMAPGTGLLASELLLGRSPHVDPSFYTISRFARRKVAG